MSYLQKTIAPVLNRVKNLFSRAVISRVYDSTKMQEVQASVLADETHDGLERIQNYGMTANPPLGSEAAIFFVNGNREHGLVTAVEDREARKAALDNVETVTDQAVGSGDVLIYTTSTNFILMRAGGNIIIHSPETIRLDAKNIEFHATEKIKWDVDGRGYDYLPDRTNTWETCTVPGSSNSCDSPEHPPDPAQ